MNNLKIDSTSGPTGWTNYTIKKLFSNRLDPTQADGLPAPGPLMDARTAFANKILAGEVTGTGRELLVTGRLTMISKGSGNGFRPICMDCCAYRAIEATSVVAACARLPSMQPLQFGGGIRNGAEIVARTDALAYDQGKAILSIDIKNAFNTTRLSIIYDGLLQADPSLLHYFRWRYGNPSTLRDNTRATVATTRTGVRQGDP